MLFLLGSGILPAAAEEPSAAGDRAGALGDFRNAADFYARELQKSVSDPEKWCRTALKLGEIRLRIGDVAGAREILSEFRRRYPARSPGTLPGEIFAAEGKYDEAEKYFLSLRQTAVDAESQRRVTFALGELALHRGRPEAEKYFREISNAESVPETWRLRALAGEIHAIINAGRYAEAEKMLRSAAAENSALFSPLELLRLAAVGELKSFSLRWQKLRPDFPPRPDPLLCEALLRAGRAAEKQERFREGAAFVGSAFDYAATDARRREILRRLINLESRIDPEAAIKSCERFIALFPGAKDVVEIRMLRGKLYAQAGKFAKAQACFAELLTAPGVPESDRVAGALAAAAAAERAGDRKAARRLFDYAIARSPLERQRRIRFLLADFYLRQKAFPAAAAVCEELLRLPGTDLAKARFRLLQALLAEKLYRRAEPVAQALAVGSGNRDYAAFGAYQRAVIAEAVGRRAEARKLYLDFIAAWPKRSEVPDARLAAAELAAAEGDHSVAEGEFAAFATAFPDHKKAPSALCMAIRSGSLAGDAAGVKKLEAELERRYPKSPERAIGALLRAEFLFNGGRATEALAIADELAKPGAAPEIAAEALFLAARIDGAAKRTSRAVERIRKLLKDYPASAVAAEAALTGGNDCFELNDYKQAEKFYRRAAELRPGGLFAAIASGRVADSLLARHAGGGPSDDLREALAIYQGLAKKSVSPALALQALYKSGVCSEYLSDDRAALAAYEKVLYLADEQKLRGTLNAPDWCARAAYAALRVISGSRLPDASQRAVRILRQYAALELPGSESELQALRKEIEKRYKGNL